MLRACTSIRLSVCLTESRLSSFRETSFVYGLLARLGTWQATSNESIDFSFGKKVRDGRCSAEDSRCAGGATPDCGRHEETYGPFVHRDNHRSGRNGKQAANDVRARALAFVEALIETVIVLARRSRNF